ncbi:MAG: class I SAM-dependent methyltransferase [Clostridiales bacterium]|nr:class I SAM-dependent methyltransferase [Clostridiales bacterium]
MRYTDINSETIDRWVDNGWEWAQPITPEQYADAKNGQWDIVLTPTKPVPKAWFPQLAGCRVLGLASGGGQQMPIFAALGAACTVLDYSQRQLDSELLVAQREGYAIKAVRADMTRPLPFADESFDLIFHPVSNCYIQEVLPLWRECRRILRGGGLLMAGLDNGINFLFDEDEKEIKYSLPFNPLKDDRQMKMLQSTDSGVQFSHSIQEQIGGQLQAGFTLKDLYEDTNSSGVLKDFGVPTFWATLAVK